MDTTIWPTSPRAPLSEEEAEAEKEERRRKRSEKKHRSSSHRHRSSKHRSSSSSKRRDDRSDESDSEDEKDRRHRRSSGHRSSRRKEEEDDVDDRKSSSRRRRHGSSSTKKRSRDESDSEDESDRSSADEGGRRGKRSRRRSTRSASPVDAHRSSNSKGKGKARADDDSADDGKPLIVRAPHDDEGAEDWEGPLDQRRRELKAATAGGDEDDDDVEVGPQLPVDDSGAPLDPRAYGGALRAGEGSAMAAYIAAGQRIPRRGEIGLEPDQIEKYESAGYVMSGSRHRRMNAVRMRKENQVISAEEQRAILKMRKEEKMKREGEIVSQFKELVDTMNPGQ
ncbi:hypothetical protein A4X09_0g6749 [Tilletia walkeri]|uniref:NF-kappa-B-activating protein C-terminal domain-containing protein n=1 Tax=Tilletia walkeri TaxID=117179 RepID=A0A8X7N3I3_9BASI|nr:hypothetical protein A4X09_0g6749 [Tilletia walkeri]